MSVRDAGKFLGARAITLGIYAGAVVGITNWDRDPNSWRLIAIHLGTAVLWLWWAVSRSIRHYHEDHPSQPDGGDEG